MSRVPRAAAIGVAVVALVLVIVAWQQDRPDLDADDARVFTVKALEDLGFDGVEVDKPVKAATYQPKSGGDPIPVWATEAEVRGGRVRLLVERDAGVAVFVEDRSADGTAQLLTDDQFRALADYEHDPPLERRVRRNIVATIAGSLVVGVAAGALAVAMFRPEAFA